MEYMAVSKTACLDQSKSEGGAQQINHGFLLTKTVWYLVLISRVDCMALR
jgi:hypothetical protein